LKTISTSKLLKVSKSKSIDAHQYSNIDLTSNASLIDQDLTNLECPYLTATQCKKNMDGQPTTTFSKAITHNEVKTRAILELEPKIIELELSTLSLH
jgi:hypothetical protein